MSKALLAAEAKDRRIMRKHAVPGTVLREFVIPAKEYASLTMKAGQTIRFVDMEGKQVPDVVCFNAHDLTDELSMGNTVLLNRRLELVRGNILYSVTANPMMTITGYSNARSYAYGPMCSEEVNRIRYGVACTRNCRDNFAMALKDWGFNARTIPDAFVPFMRVEVDARGNIEICEPTSKAGDYYDLRAEMDLVVGISNCPQERNPCNGWKPTPTGVIVYAS